MSELYDRIISEKGKLENLMMKIPGFKGYHEKQARRQADQMLRDYLAQQVAACNDRFLQIEKKILKLDNGLSLMSATREAKDQVRIYGDRLRSAAPGYSGMWAAMKIGNAELEELYAFDEAQLRYIDQINAKLDQLEAAVRDGQNVSDAISAVYDVALEADQAFKLREDVLSRINESLS